MRKIQQFCELHCAQHRNLESLQLAQLLLAVPMNLKNGCVCCQMLLSHDYALAWEWMPAPNAAECPALPELPGTEGGAATDGSTSIPSRMDLQ